MPNVDIAERILALVTTGDRAASVAGDLTEGTAARGVFWFWLGVSRTATSLLWRNIAEQPGRLCMLAFLSLAVYLGVELLFAGLIGLVFFGAAMASGHPLHLDSIGWNLWLAAPVLVSSLFIGRMLARLAPGRELAACAVYTILVSIYNLVPMLGDSGVLAALLCILMVPAGAAWGRNRRLRAT